MNWLSDFDLHLYTDSAGNSQLGCGVYLQGQLAYFHCPYDWQDTDIITDITFEELVLIVLAVMLFKSLFHIKKIMFHICRKYCFSSNSQQEHIETNKSNAFGSHNSSLFYDW